MASFTWTNPAGGDWSVASNWSLPAGISPPRAPRAGDVANLNNLASSYTVTVAAGSTVGSSSGGPFIEFDATASIGAPALSISGTLTANIIYYTNPGDPATSVTIEAGGSLDTPLLFYSLDVPQTVTISAAAGTAGGHLELGGPDVGGLVSGTNSLVTFDFANTGPTSLNTGVIQIDNASSPDIVTTQTMADVAWGDEFVITGANFTGDTVALSQTTDVLTVTDPSDAIVFTMDNVFLQAGATNKFVASDDVIQALCYARGTMIRTPAGESRVEKLRPGKQVITLVDGQEIPRIVVWLGHRRIRLAGHPRPETVAPILIQRDAFADGMPHHDLLVSPDHAIYVQGRLICARQLVNRVTIRQELDWTAVDYYHIELDRHAILLAAGLPAESYLDTANRGFFANSGAPMVLHPDLTDETCRPTREAGSCAPFVWDEASVQPVWQQLADRAAATGRPVRQLATTTDATLRLLANRHIVEPITGTTDLVGFLLASSAREVRLVSRAQSPTEARPWLEDRRRLGIRVKRIVLRSAEQLREIPIDHPDLAQGWWAVERDGQIMSRWTDGEAVLPLPEMSGLVMLEIHLAGAMTYIVDAVPACGTGQRAAA